MVQNSKNGELLAHLPYLGTLTALGLHSSKPQLVCGDISGAMHILEIVALEYGPILVTAWRFSTNSLFQKHDVSLAFGCPHCHIWHEITKSWR